MNIKELRTKKGVSQTVVAKAIGCSTNVYSRYERGEREPSIDLILKLAEYFDVTVDFMLGKEDTDLTNFTRYEIDMIKAARGADDRAKKDALDTLLKYQVDIK